MLNMKTEPLENNAVKLILEGEAKIENIAEIKEKFIEILNSAEGLELDYQGLKDTDLSFLQLLCSAHRTFMSKGKYFKFAGDVTEELAKNVDKHGYRRHVGCKYDKDCTCIWKLEEAE